jgi:hypothetical protein
MFFINPFIYAGGGDFESIATVTVGSGGAATVDFTSIPGTYQHLQIRGLARSSTASTGFEFLSLRFNSDTASNYARHSLQGDGATPQASGQASQTEGWVRNILPRNNTTANIFGACVIDILDYASTSKTKTVRALGGGDANGSGWVSVSSSLWNNAGSAITSVTLLSEANNLVQHSTFALYGVKAP